MYYSLVGRIQEHDGVIYVVTNEGEAGCVVFGPYSVLWPGSYQVEFYAMPQEINNRTCCVVDILRRGRTISAEKDFTAGELIHRNGKILLRFEVVAKDTFEFRLMSTGASGLTVRYRRPLRLIPAPILEPLEEG